MLKIRIAHPAVHSGHFREILFEGECYVFERKLKKETLLIAANFSAEDHESNLPHKTLKDLTSKALMRRCTIKNDKLKLSGCGYFLGEIKCSAESCLL